MPDPQLVRLPAPPPIVILCIALLGCGSQPIPLVAVGGTTITLALPASFPTGFGNAWMGLPSTGGPNPPPEPPYNPASLFEDPQRGELQFQLYDATDNLVRILPVRFITRVQPSPSSIGGSIYNTGQTLAFLDIPVMPELSGYADYRIRIRRVRRMPKSSDPDNAYELVDPPAMTSDGQPWTGWGDEPVAGSADYIKITIREHDGLEHFTPLRTWEDMAGSGVTSDAADLDELIPHPEFEVRVPETGSTEGLPAAWEMVLVYPREKLRIRDVTLLRPSKSEAMVRWKADNPDAVVPCTTTPGLLTIRVIDPDRVTPGVAVAYQLRNFETSCGGRAAETDFGEWTGTFKAYDVDGNDITSSIGWEIPPSSFF